MLRSEIASGSVGVQKVRDVCRCSAVKCLEGEEENLKLYPLVDGEPVECRQDRCDVLMMTCSLYDSSRNVLNSLQLSNVFFG